MPCAIDELPPQLLRRDESEDFSSVSEHPGIAVTREAMAMLRTRYTFAARLCKDQTVLEVACGAGLGLSLLAKSARAVVGGDYSQSMLHRARKHYGDRIPLLRLDAHSLPFAPASFDAVILYESIYYLADPERFFRESRRVLRPGGTLLLCSANPEWSGFSPSGMSKRYYSADELSRMLRANRFDPRLYGAFPAVASTPLQKLVALLRLVAVHCRLIPKTMKGKEKWKRFFYGRLITVGNEIEEEAAAEPQHLHPLSATEKPSGYKVLYAVARC